jgi:hypothetical protein
MATSQCSLDMSLIAQYHSETLYQDNFMHFHAECPGRFPPYPINISVAVSLVTLANPPETDRKPIYDSQQLIGIAIRVH